MCSSMHTDNMGKDNWRFGEGAAQGLGYMVLTGEAKFPIDFTQPRQEICIKSAL